LEDLSDIREQTRLRKAQRARHSNWAFAQLRQFISYKADTNAAINISRAAVSPPIVSETALPSRQGQAHPL
jgi:transposase